MEAKVGQRVYNPKEYLPGSTWKLAIGYYHIYSIVGSGNFYLVTLKGIDWTAVTTITPFNWTYPQFPLSRFETNLIINEPGEPG